GIVIQEALVSTSKCLFFVYCLSKIIYNTMTRFISKLSFGVMCILLLSSSLMAQANQIPSSEPPKHEFRSVWLTTAFGLDFPGNVTGMEAQQAKLKQFVDRAYEMRMNAI